MASLVKSDTKALNALSEAMRDIVVDKKENSIFYEYRDKQEIGKLVFKAIMDKRAQSADGKTFEFSDSIREPGILSTAQVLQTLLILVNDYNLPLDDEVVGVCRELVDDMLKRVENRTHRYDLFEMEGIKAKDRPEGAFLLDATPYDVDFSVNGSDCFSYIDSLTWVLPVALDLLRTNCFNKDVLFGSAIEKKLVALSKFCIKYLNVAFVANPQSSRMTCGWNFTWKCVNPSLYYTYAVGECCQSIRANYGDFLDPEKGTSLVDTESGKRFAAMLFDINDELPHKNVESPVGCLLANLLRAAEGIWAATKENIDDKFYSYDLSIVEDDTIRHSQSSDALFNMVFIVNTVISSGLNDVIEDRIQTAKNPAEKEKYQKELSEMFELIQLAMQRTSRFYNDLKAVGRDYIVDQYYAVFNENYVYHKVLAKELRKRRIRMMSLLPVVISTITLLGEFMIKYPQVEMMKYLDSLMNDRIQDEKGYIWLWEKDCYYTTSTFYYISSLAGFYRYYEEYEARFARIDTENNEYRAKIIEEQMNSLTSEGGEIDTLKRRIAELEEENRLQKEKLAEGSPVENAINDLCQNALKDGLLTAFNSMMTGILKATDPAEAQRLTKDERAFMENAKLLLVRIFFGAGAFDMAGDAREDLNGKNQKDAYAKLIKFIRQDVINATQCYTKQVAVSVKHESDFVSTNGYEGIRTALSRKKD